MRFKLPTLAAILLLLQPTGAAHGTFTKFVVGGDATPASIQPTVDAFHRAIGGSNNGVAGSTIGGWRELDWDNQGDSTATLSPNFLTEHRNTRGATVSANGAGSALLQTPVSSSALTNINPGYATKFTAFSAQRILTPYGGNRIDVEFYLPGTNGLKRGTTSAFGVVFSDVDKWSSANRIELYGPDLANPNTIAVIEVLPGTIQEGSLTFAGIVGDAHERIARAVIHFGDLPLNAGMEDPNTFSDVVVLDNFIYAEPVPEPNCAILSLVSAAAMAGASRRTSRRH